MNSATPLIFQIVKAWASHLPAIIGFVVALIIILIRWNRAPRGSLFALLGVGLNLLLALGMPAIYLWIPELLRKGGTFSPERMGNIYLGLNVVNSVLYMAASLLLLAGVYAGRSKPIG